MLNGKIYIFKCFHKILTSRTCILSPAIGVKYCTIFSNTPILSPILSSEVDKLNLD